MLPKMLESKQVSDKGKKGFAKTVYSFPKLKKKISVTPRDQPKITAFFKAGKLETVKKNLNFS